MDGYACALRFDTNSPQFIRGVEVGRLWEILKGAREGRVEEYVHSSNAEMVLRIAEATGWNAESEELNDDWLLVTFRATER